MERLYFWGTGEDCFWSVVGLIVGCFDLELFGLGIFWGHGKDKLLGKYILFCFVISVLLIFKVFFLVFLFVQ